MDQQNFTSKPPSVTPAAISHTTAAKSGNMNGMIDANFTQPTVVRRVVTEEREEEKLYRNVCGGTAPLTRLEEYLAKRACQFGLSQDSLTKLPRAEAKQRSTGATLWSEKPVELMKAIDARRHDSLKQIVAIGSGSWRDDLKTYVERSGPPALDDLFILGGEVSASAVTQNRPIAVTSKPANRK